MTDRTLSIDLAVELHQPGPNRRWSGEREVAVPPAFQEHDILPFVRHEVEKTVTALEREHLGGARAADIIAAYELRSRVIRHLLRTAPREAAVQALRTRIADILDLDNETLVSLWGRGDVEE